MARREFGKSKFLIGYFLSLLLFEVISFEKVNSIASGKLSNFFIEKGHKKNFFW